MTFNLFVFHSVSFIQFSPPKILYPFLFNPTHVTMPSQPHFSLLYHPKIILWIINITKFCFVSFCAVASYTLPLTPTHLPVQSPVIPSHLHPHISLNTLFSNTLSRCPSLPPVSCSLIFVFYISMGRRVRLVHKELDGSYTEVVITSFVHACVCGLLNEWSSTESLITWKEFRQSLSFCLLDWHQSEHK